MADLGSAAALKTANNARVNDNSSGDVTPADVRASLTDTVDTIYAAVGLKHYICFLTQEGTSAPTGTPLVNTLGVTPVYSYNDIGSYRLTSAGAFPVGKTIVRPIGRLTATTDGFSGLVVDVIDADTIYIDCRTEGEGTDDTLNGKLGIEITVYP